MARFIRASFQVGVLDIQRGDIVGQQHHLIAKKLVLIFMAQRAAAQAVDDVDRSTRRAGSTNSKRLPCVFAIGAKAGSPST
jgi:hypothetical protein